VNPPRDRLFHVLVTLGIAAASGAACGKSHSTASDEGAGGSSGSDPNETGGSAGTSSLGGSSGEIVTAGFAGVIATGGTGAEAGGAGPAIGGNFGLGGEGGDSCESTAQIWCQTYEPEPLDCYCDPNAPITPEDCTGRGQFRCESYDPPLSCQCIYITGPR
jgi:hypothetical protein